jgi:hypothetical protein
MQPFMPFKRIAQALIKLSECACHWPAALAGSQTELHDEQPIN